MIWLKALALWSVILVLAVANGALRESVLLPLWGLPAAQIASGAILSGCILAVAFVGTPWYGGLSQTQSWIIGVAWLLLTLLFEFGFGRFVQQSSFAELLEAYTFSGGNIWPIVLVVTFAAPWLAAKLAERRRAHR
jgi:uncharacterized membrane protein (DUF485 family)